MLHFVTKKLNNFNFLIIRRYSHKKVTNITIVLGIPLKGRAFRCKSSHLLTSGCGLSTTIPNALTVAAHSHKIMEYLFGAKHYL